ncbi:MAG: SDR family oxidoreductase [candidate division WOR-3 bacterium]|nr:MAG: SDR family oxidoreductase [candidate division WOR-3 bacterium]
MTKSTRILVLGADGMLGHKVCQALGETYQVWGTTRRQRASLARYGFLPPDRCLGHVDARSMSSVLQAMESCKPDTVVNCIAVLKQSCRTDSSVESIRVNSWLPRVLARECRITGVRLIQVSTDGVFAGSKGCYKETDQPDATDLYGISKLLGEVDEPGCLTLRTAPIGREIRTSRGLVEWFLSKKRGDEVRGFTKALFSGLSSLALSRILLELVTEHKALGGIYHLASSPISKYRLLTLLNQAYDRRITIRPCDVPEIDRTLDGTKLRRVTGIEPPSWETMVQGMVSDPTPYALWRSYHAN